MEYTRLGGSGVQVSRICLGMMGMGDPAWRPWILDEGAARPVFRSAVELGVNFIDTADTYSAGASERLAGKFVREFARRDEMIVMSKVYNPVSLEFKSGQDPASWAAPRRPNTQGLSRKRIFEAIDATLERLGFEYLDIYQIHRWDYATPVEEFMEALHDVVKSGRVRYIGASSMWAWQFAKAQHVAEQNGWTRFVSMQNHYNLAYREEEREMLPLLRDTGVACVPWSPLARGFLARDEASGTGDARWEGDKLRRQYYSGDSDRAVAGELAAVARERGVTRAQAAIAWLLSPDSAGGGVTAPIAGPGSAAELEELVAATSLRLSPEDVKRLEAPYRPKAVLGHL